MRTAISGTSDASDDVIKSSGYRIGPFEIEVGHHGAPVCPRVRRSPRLRTRSADRLSRRRIVLVKGKEKSDELKKEIQNYVKTHTAPYKYPRIVEFMDELPKTISGKIRRVELRNNDNNKK